MHVQENKSTPTLNLATLEAMEADSSICVITFPSGLYGFPESRSFALTALKNPKYDGFMHLLNLEEPGLTFLLLPIYKQGSPLVDRQEIKSLGNEIAVAENGYDLFAIVSLQNVTEEAIDCTLNIQAPLVVDPHRNIAWQHIVNGSEFKTDYRL